MSSSSRSYSSQKTNSVYGGAGGHGTRVSSPTVTACFGPSSSYGSRTSFSNGGFNLTDGLDLHVGANEKATMQNLNDRLSTYLDKVRTLEKENGHLELQIREWTLSRTVVTHDHSGYLATVADLKDKIRFACRVNAKIILDIDNAKLAADDFKMNSSEESPDKSRREDDQRRATAPRREQFREESRAARRRLRRSARRPPNPRRAATDSPAK
ncbi:unnamed protein product [Boreogadus saida]